MTMKKIALMLMFALSSFSGSSPLVAARVQTPALSSGSTQHAAPRPRVQVALQPLIAPQKRATSWPTARAPVQPLRGIAPAILPTFQLPSVDVAPDVSALSLKPVDYPPAFFSGLKRLLSARAHHLFDRKHLGLFSHDFRNVLRNVVREQDDPPLGLASGAVSASLPAGTAQNKPQSAAGAASGRAEPRDDAPERDYFATSMAAGKSLRAIRAERTGKPQPPLPADKNSAAGDAGNSRQPTLQPTDEEIEPGEDHSGLSHWIMTMFTQLAWLM